MLKPNLFAFAFCTCAATACFGQAIAELPPSDPAPAKFAQDDVSELTAPSFDSEPAKVDSTPLNAATDDSPEFDSPTPPREVKSGESSSVANQSPFADTLPTPQEASAGAYRPTPLPAPTTAELRSSTNATAAPRTVQIQYSVRRPQTVEFHTPDGKHGKVVRYVVETQSAKIDVTEDLDKLEDLPAEGRRIAVLTVTAARHQGLLDALKAAETAEEKAAAKLALEENYTQHYAIETWWREQKLAELEARLKELRDQVTQRQESEEKYVTAAMTIAELWANGIDITPPSPSRQPLGPPVGVQLPQALQPNPTPTTYQYNQSNNTYTPTYGPTPTPNNVTPEKSSPAYSPTVRTSR